MVPQSTSGQLAVCLQVLGCTSLLGSCSTVNGMLQPVWYCPCTRTALVVPKPPAQALQAVQPVAPTLPIRLRCAAPGAELLLRKPWLPGTSDLDQLTRIFAALGTPSPETWPGCEALPTYVEFRPVPAPPLRQQFPQARRAGLVPAELCGSSCPWARAELPL
jgi:hypothetical protein